MDSEALLILAQKIATLTAEINLSSRINAAPAQIQEQKFIDVPINLANADLAGSGLALPFGGYEISYLRRTSTPGGLLQLADTGAAKPFAPGDKVELAFPAGQLLKLATGSVAAGTAMLRIAQLPLAKFHEYQGDNINITPTALLGSITAAGAVTFVTVAKDVIPSGAATGSFSISGWSTILVLIDTTSAAGTATTFDLVPWYQPPGLAASAVWFEQGTERVSVPDTNVSGGQYRVVAIDLTRAQGNLYLAINNLLAAGRTGLGLCVLGVA